MEFRVCALMVLDIDTILSVFEKRVIVLLDRLVVGRVGVELVLRYLVLSCRLNSDS